MNKIEQDRAAGLPSEFRPMGAWEYFGYSLLFSLPLVGFICLIIFSCSGSNINRRSFARSYFCGFLIVGIILVIVVVLMVTLGSGFIAQLQELLNSYMSMLQ